MPVLGIDIGNENTSISVYHDGKFTVIHGDTEKTTTPSYVAYTGNDWLVGETAKANMKENYYNTVYDFPILLGKRFSDLSAAQMEHWRFDFAEKDGDLVIIFEADGVKQVFTPEYVLTRLLKWIRTKVDEQLGKAVTDVVIAVPCHMGLRSKLSLKNAAWSAGFNVLKLVHKPVAAAIASCPPVLLKGKSTLLVVDVGARRVEVTLFTMNKGLLKQKTHLTSSPEGGWICDDRLAKTFMTPLLKKDKVREDQVAALICLHQASESLKHQLTTSKKAKVQVEGILAPGKKTAFSLTIKKFDKHNIRLFSELETCINSTLGAVGLKYMNVDCTILVGGASKILQVRNLLYKLFGEDRVLTNVDPDLAVSYGAAIQGSFLTSKTSACSFARENVDRSDVGSAGEFIFSMDNKGAESKHQDPGAYQSDTLDYFRMLRTTANDVSSTNHPMVSGLHTRFKMKCDNVIKLLQTSRSYDLENLRRLRQDISEDWGNFTCRLLRLLVSSSAIGAKDQEPRVTRRQEATSFAISIRKRLDNYPSVSGQAAKQVEEVRSMCDNLLQYIGYNELLDFDRMITMRQMLEQKWKQLQTDTHKSVGSENSVSSQADSDNLVYALPGDDSDSDNGSLSQGSRHSGQNAIRIIRKH